MRVVFLCAFAFALAGCESYEYEEEVFLATDGSGNIRISGTHELLGVIHDVEAPGVSSMRARFEDPALRIDSVRETSRDGRRYIHVQGRFEDWNALCRHPVFRVRDCGLRREDQRELSLFLSVPAITPERPNHVEPDDVLAFRFHFPSSVRFHNSRHDVERGNIIRWQRTAEELFGGDELRIEARFERRSVLATTVIVFGTALGLVVLTRVRRALLDDTEGTPPACGRKKSGKPLKRSPAWYLRLGGGSDCCALSQGPRGPRRISFRRPCSTDSIEAFLRFEMRSSSTSFSNA